MFRSATSYNPICHIVPTAQSPAKRGWRTKALRRVLLASVTVGAMMVSHSQIVQAQEKPSTTDSTAPCYSADGVTVDCTGDVTGGIRIDNRTGNTSYTTLNVNNVTDITPAEGVAGIWFWSNTGDVTIIGDEANPFDITTSGDQTEGILARAGKGGAVNVQHWGNITTTGISSEGIDAKSFGGGTVEVEHWGNITTEGALSDALCAFALQGGDVFVTQVGNISSALRPLLAQSYTEAGGDVTVVMVGDAEVTVGDRWTDGINASSFGDGDVSITHTGNVTNHSTGELANGLFAYPEGNGSITINHSGGTIDVAGGDGIIAWPTSGNISIKLGAQSRALDDTLVTGSNIISKSGVGVAMLGGGTNTLNIYNTRPLRDCAIW